MAESKSILNLSTTEFDRPIVTIDGERYGLRPPEEMSVLDLKRQYELARRIRICFTENEAGERQVKDDLSDEQFDALFDAAPQMVKILLQDIPDEVLDRMPVGMCNEILNKHTELFRKAAGEEESPAAQTPSPTD